MIRKILLFAIAFAFISASLSAELMTPEKLWSLKRIGAASISPDGKQVLIQISTPNIKENNSTSDLFLVNINGGELRQITTNGEHNYGGVWSPDGKKILFISDRSDDAPQAYILNMGGGEAVQLTDLKNGVSAAKWSPDGKWISFVSEVKLDSTIQEIYPDLDKAEVVMYDKLPARHWDHWIDENYSHLFIISSAGGEPKDLTPDMKFDTPLAPFGGSEEIAWSADSKKIAYTCRKVVDYSVSTNSDIYVIDIATGATENITEENDGYDMAPIFSPDGKYIAYHSQEKNGFESNRIRIMLHDIASKKNKDLTADFDDWAGNILWSPDSKKVYFNSTVKATSKIYSVDLDGNIALIKDNPKDKFYNYGDRVLELSPDGKTFLLSRRNYNRPTELFTMPAEGGTLEALTHVNDEEFKNIETTYIEERYIKSFDGAKVQTWVVYPPNFDRTKKYPVIVYCQGGPQQPVNQYWSYGWNFLAMASQGYIIVAPNRRGCPGFGQDWVDAMTQDWGGKAMDDILATTDAIAKESFVDKDRIGAIGGSAGGYTTFWLEGNHKGRFSAFVSHCGVFNLESMMGATEELFFPLWENGGPYWENWEYYEKNSPHRFADNWDTPILIITGEKDYRVPYTQSLEAFTVCQMKGIPSKLICYPNENHWVLKPQNKVFWYREFFSFLAEYLKK
jgi:dipeptidyl aminopeptidase/acylaminoacyl peptidase